MEIGIAKKILRKNNPQNTLRNTTVLLKPGKLQRKRAIVKPAQHKVSVIALSPTGFFKDGIADIHKEMTKTYGNIPLWVKYTTVPNSVSWNLGATNAVHNLHVYGEEQFTKEFLSRFSEMLASAASNKFGNGITILSQNPLQLVQEVAKGTSSLAALPSVIQKTDNKANSHSDLLGTSGLIAGLAGVILALSFFSIRKSGNSKRHVTRKEALQAAIDSVGDLASATPVLKGEDFTGNEWHFNLSDYAVTVNNRGAVTEIRKAEEND